ncbi:response regulator transcription factor [Paenibacillus antarcticus]|uniref:DNA-binding response regulator n=1 Tax=Paenibacillus antarcticus TaxID=253703 RepID=A0A162KAS3_9BACL|nr:response regulator [Paenibacillus antarcticus]OAB43048.1 hypothetical protein PBAT_18790 [Paenibacillus antarcticus]
MIKVLIVDDEMLSRVGIKSLIAWNEKGYMVVGEAENGRKAFQLIQELQPDIVISDIKMPVMNGIELIEQANKGPYQPAFIILSSYDDFDYVKQALMLGAKDYFLKLELTPEQLLGAMDRIKDERFAEQKQFPKFKQSYVEQLTANDYQIVKNNFLKEIIQGRNCEEEEIQSKLNALGILLPKERLQCGVVLINGMEVYPKYKKNERHLFQYTVENIISEIVLDYRFAHAVVSQSKEIIIVFAHEESDQMDHDMHELMRAIMKALKVYLNITGSTGTSKIRNGYHSIKHSYKDALEDANQSSQVNLIRFEVGKDELVSEINHFIKNFEHVLHTFDMEKLKHCLAQLIEKIKRVSDRSKDVLKSLCSTLLLSISNFITNQAKNLTLEEVWGSNPFHSIEHLHTNFDFIVWFEEFENSISSIFNSLGESSKLIHQAKQYIHKHYSSNVSLEGIADELNISPNYLSTLFRKETSESLVEYLTRYRIDRAKEYLLTTHYRVYEIGQMVGYESEQYFSRVFKKVVGMPPAKYKL